MVSALACCNGDTWASEIGAIFSSGLPRLVTNPWRRVPRGTNGGISPLGLVVSLLGGALVGAAHYVGVALFSPSFSWQQSPAQFLPLLGIGGAAGLLGSLIDSLLGATLQFSGQDKDGSIVEFPGPDVKRISGMPILDNHGVNLLSCIFTSMVVPNLALKLMV